MNYQISKPMHICIEIRDMECPEPEDREHEFEVIPNTNNTFSVLFDSHDVGILFESAPLKWQWKEGTFSQQYADLIGEQILKFEYEEELED